MFYLDDLNLPYVETYGTQNALSLLRQVIDHKSYYDRTDLGARKEVRNMHSWGGAGSDVFWMRLLCRAHIVEDRGLHIAESIACGSTTLHAGRVLWDWE